MATFLTSLELFNDLNSDANYKFTNGSVEHCLFGDCRDTLASKHSYDPESQNDSPTTHGFYLPAVTSQPDLDANHGKFVIPGSSDIYTWLEPNNDNVMVLCTGGSAEFGYGTPVPLNVGGHVNADNLLQTRLRITNGGGTVIILGVLDSVEEDK